MIKRGKRSKKAQLTIIIFVAIVIVLAIILFYLLKDNLFQTDIPRNMRPVYDSYLDCIKSITREGAYLLGQQGGYIKLPDFEPASSYRPFSNQLDFLGQPIPYWMYISGNNVLKEQIPTKTQMQNQLQDYIQERIDFCNLDIYKEQGFGIYIQQTGDTKVNIKDSSIEVQTTNPLTIYHGQDSILINQHKIDLNLRLGSLYEQAKQLYNYEKTDMFLEKYALDVLRLHAPADGVEIQCTPIIFEENKIRDDIIKGLTANMNFLKVKGRYYELSKKENEYFVVEPGFTTDTNINFMYNPQWPTRIEIYGDMVANPVGVQEGLSILGFCYVPYHLVYDINFPVLIQLWEGDFFFQFPLSVIIEKNYARQALPPMFESQSLESPICEHNNQNIMIYTYDAELNPLPARLQFQCLQETCHLGESRILQNDAVFTGKVSQCLNGIIIADAPGYAQTKYQISTNTETIADIILPKIYTIDLDLANIPGDAVITFKGEKYSQTVVYPETRKINLIEDFYNISVFAYTDSSLTLKGTNEINCVDVPLEGLASLPQLTQEKCFELNIPEMQIEKALIGGGMAQEYITEDSLKRARKLNINVPIFYTPESIEDLQKNYVLVEDTPVYITLQ